SVTSTSTDAINGSQLYAVAKQAAKTTTVNAGSNIVVTEAANATGGVDYTVSTADNLNVTSVTAADGAGNTSVTSAAGTTTKDAAGNTSTLSATGVTFTPTSGNAVSLTTAGLNNGGNTITNVAAG
ncbi:hypothetical protein ACP2WS_11325, partial [Brachymonas sp. M4Q-1]